MEGARYTHATRNKKTGLVAVTYASTKGTCPTSCKFADNGCYAEHGRVGMFVRKLNKEGEGRSPEQLARHEARALDMGAVTPDRPLRLHVAGDSRTQRAARTVAAAAERYMARGGGPAWTYTHAWPTVPRKAWGGVSALASLEDPHEAKQARRQGYAPALVVDEHPADGRAWRSHGIKWIPCPEQTSGVQCVTCRLCFDADGLKKRKAGIAFAAHGGGVKRALTVLND